jgi:hypothetical protein
VNCSAAAAERNLRPGAVGVTVISEKTMADNGGSGAGMGMIVGALLVIVVIIGAVVIFGGGNLFGGSSHKSVDVSVSSPNLPTPGK